MLKDLREIFNHFETNPVDFRFDRGLKLPSHYSGFLADMLEPFGNNKAGCAVCYWNKKKLAAQAPVVWLDSEGTPNVVFAKNLSNFLELLSYGTGLIYDIIRQSERKIKDDTLLSPAEKYKGAFRETFITNSTDSEKKKFSELLFNKMNIVTTKNPGTEIFLNYKNFLDITNLINQNIQ